MAKDLSQGRAQDEQIYFRNGDMFESNSENKINRENDITFISPRHGIFRGGALKQNKELLLESFLPIGSVITFLLYFPSIP